MKPLAPRDKRTTEAIKQAKDRKLNLVHIRRTASDRSDIAFVAANPKHKNKITLPKLRCLEDK